MSEPHCYGCDCNKLHPEIAALKESVEVLDSENEKLTTKNTALRAELALVVRKYEEDMERMEGMLKGEAQKIIKLEASFEAAGDTVAECNLGLLNLEAANRTLLFDVEAHQKALRQVVSERDALKAENEKLRAALKLCYCHVPKDEEEV